MTPNIASPLFNTLLAAFFVVVVLGAALGAYAANQLKRFEKDEVGGADTTDTAEAAE